MSRQTFSYLRSLVFKGGVHLVTATNDSGRYGPGVELKVVTEDSPQGQLSVVQSLRVEADFLRQKIMDLQRGLLEVNQLEFELRGRLDDITPEGNQVL
jgi:hypothetical protein